MEWVAGPPKEIGAGVGIKQWLKKVPVARQAATAYRYFQLQSRFKAEDTSDSRNPLGNIPWPPARLRYRVHGQADRNSFARVGKECAENILGILSSQGISLTENQSVLDFGCGCGRVLRHLSASFPKVRFFGTDIDREGVEWCQQNLNGGSFTVNDIQPPAPYPSGHFDFLYAISIFTHLDEGFQFKWLDDIARMIKPGGMALLTVRDDKERSLSPDDHHRLEKQGFLFAVHETGRFKKDGLPDFYQTAYHTEAYIRKNWERGLDLMAYLPAAINHHQDAVLLRRRRG